MKNFDLIIIGAGPAGYVAAIRAGQLGLNTAIIEKQNIGGMCLNWGCIPSKALIESVKLFAKIGSAKQFGIEGINTKDLSFNWQKAVGRKDRLVGRLVKGVEFLLKKNNVEIITGEAKITGPKEVMIDSATYSAGKIIIATGSRPNRDAIRNVDMDTVVEVDEFYQRDDLPEAVLVFGGNPAAMETAFILRTIGKKVSLVTPDDSPVPFLDETLTKYLTDKLKKLGVKTYYGAELTKQGEGGVYAGDDFIECEMIINCADRKPIIPETSGVDIKLDPAGIVEVDGNLKTSIDSIYAVGDVTGQIFAHIGSAQGIAAVNHIADIKQEIDYKKLPTNIYLDPEISSVGYTEAELKDKGIDYKVGEFPMSANGKAMTEGYMEGFVKVLAESKYGEVMGVHIVAPHATDMIAEAVSIMRLEGTLEDIGQVVHAHPTVSETVMEAVFKAMGRPIHIM